MNTSAQSRLKELLARGHFAVTAECGPPRGADAAVIQKKGGLLAGFVDAVNVTDNQSAVVRMCSLAACKHLMGLGIEPVLQMVTRDRNRIVLQSDAQEHTLWASEISYASPATTRAWAASPRP